MTFRSRSTRCCRCRGADCTEAGSRGVHRHLDEIERLADLPHVRRRPDHRWRASSRVLRDGTVTAGQRVAELSSAGDDRMPNVRRDGLEIVFSSTRQGFNGQDIWFATRRSTRDPWGAPQRLTDPAINTPGAETRASLLADGARLYFGRDGDVFVSTRSKARRNDD